MRSIFIIHGSDGNPQENWFPWLKHELENIGEHVIVPQFPVPKVHDGAFSGHDLDKWLSALGKYRQYINSETVIVAHSRGCVFTYRLLERTSQTISSVYLVAPWIVYRWYPKGWNEIDSFHQTPFDWDKIKSSCRYFEVYQSTNDDTPVAEGREIAQKLDAKLYIVRNAGHFNTASKPEFVRFPQLLKNVKKHLSKFS